MNEEKPSHSQCLEPAQPSQTVSQSHGCAESAALMTGLSQGALDAEAPGAKELLAKYPQFTSTHQPQSASKDQSVSKGAISIYETELSQGGLGTEVEYTKESQPRCQNQSQKQNISPPNKSCSKSVISTQDLESPQRAVGTEADLPSDFEVDQKRENSEGLPQEHSTAQQDIKDGSQANCIEVKGQQKRQTTTSQEPMTNSLYSEVNIQDGESQQAHQKEQRKAECSQEVGQTSPEKLSRVQQAHQQIPSQELDTQSLFLEMEGNQEESQALISYEETENVTKEVDSPKEMERHLKNSGIEDYSNDLKIKEDKEEHASEEIPQRPIISVTQLALAESEHQVLNQAVAMNMCTVAQSVSDHGVTHYVVEKAAITGDRRMEQKRRLAYAKALCLGLWVVSFEWVEQSQSKGHWLPAEDYEILGTVADSILQAPQRSRKSHGEAKPKLLQDYQFLVSMCQRDAALSLDELITLAGGKYIGAVDLTKPNKDVEAWVPKSLEEGRTTVMLVTNMDQPHKNQIQKLSKKLLPTKLVVTNKAWLLDSISNFQVQDLRKAKYIFR